MEARTSRTLSLQEYAFIAIARTLKISQIIERAKCDEYFDRLVFSRAFMVHLLYHRTPAEIEQVYSGPLREYLIKHFPWKLAIGLHYPGIHPDEMMGVTTIHRYRAESNTDYINCFIRLARATWFKLSYNSIENKVIAVENLGQVQPKTNLPTQERGTPRSLVEIIFPNTFRSKYSDYRGKSYDHITDHILLTCTKAPAGFALKVEYCASRDIIINYAMMRINTGYPPTYGDDEEVVGEAEFCRKYPDPKAHFVSTGSITQPLGDIQKCYTLIRLPLNRTGVMSAGE